MPTRLTKAPRIDLELVRAFVAVHDAGSFSAAALRLGVPRSTVSRAVAALEESLALLLFHRTTRRVATTAAGVALYDRVAPALGTIDAALSDLPDTEEEPSGTLRLTTTPDLGTIVVAEAVTRYTARYPRTQVELQLSSSLVDLVRDGFDLALRVSPGPRRDSALIARKVGDIMIQLYAAPAYLARRGTPRSPAELRDHDWIGFRGAAPLQLSASGARSVIQARPRVICDDMFFAREVLRTGGGIGALPSFIADGDLADGRLVHLLPRWVSRTGTVSLVHPSRRHIPRRVNAFRDLLLEMLRQRPLSSIGTR
jgi:DNA-binding transcriptional LysR family regulator